MLGGPAETVGGATPSNPAPSPPPRSQFIMSVLAPQSAFAAAPAPLVHEMVGKGDFADAGPLKAPKLDLRVKAFANCAIMRTHG